MKKHYCELKELLRSFHDRSISMQHKLLLYFLSIVVVIVGIVFVVLTVTGLLSFSEQHIKQGIEMSLDYSVSKIHEQFDHLTAYGIRMAKQVGNEIDYLLEKNNISFEELNDNPKQLEELQQAIYNPIYTALELGDCSGSYVVLDVTRNTKKNASSRSGLYLRRSSVNTGKPVQSDLALFRGTKEVARKNKIELHNRWNMEFDIAAIPNYQELINRAQENSGEYVWSEEISLPKTWENIMLLSVPIIGKNHEVYGVCGIEMSGLYFQLSYPSVDSEFGALVTVLAPRTEDTLCVDQGLSGADNGGKFAETSMEIKNMDHLERFVSNGNNYMGLTRDITLSSKGWKDTQWTVAVLLPQYLYERYVESEKIILIVGSLLLLFVLVFISFMLSHRYVKPITQRLQAIQEGEPCSEKITGISEIDELIQFLQAKKEEKSIDQNKIPDGISDIFDHFIERVHTLTESEYNIFQYYVSGYQIVNIPELAYISMSTVRKHNRSIYEKLDVASRDEMMLYIDLLRRCGRLHEITEKQHSRPAKTESGAPS